MERSQLDISNSNNILPEFENEVVAEESTRNDLIAGWLGGAGE